ncbi:hypothetical protein Taro_023777 [Colocasia esculenta]|uniref:Uncharacterized protein n=1 Tax=Colocasia esculenta TaxID=4460 RepID=A0A843VBS6_COLES|nr:hypothetical protein [Colocasia esculenta]
MLGLALQVARPFWAFVATLPEVDKTGTLEKSELAASRFAAELSRDPTMSHGGTIPLHPSSQSDIDEIESIINASVQAGPATVLPARAPSPPRASIPDGRRQNIGAAGFGPPPNTLTEPVWDTVKRDLSQIVSNLKLVVFLNPFREDPGGWEGVAGLGSLRAPSLSLATDLHALQTQLKARTSARLPELRSMAIEKRARFGRLDQSRRLPSSLSSASSTAPLAGGRSSSGTCSSAHALRRSFLPSLHQFATSPGLKTYFKTPEGRYKLQYEKTHPAGLLHYSHG